MRIRILDLDGSVVEQSLLLRRSNPVILSMHSWGPRLRMVCGHGSFEFFESCLTQAAGTFRDSAPHLTFLGSGDFHHVTLALLRRLPRPFNLLVLDNHPDWMRGIPLLHCGTWLFHAAQLPMVRRIFHVGGEVDFDNRYRWLTPWDLLLTGKIVVAPAFRSFRRGNWKKIAHKPLRTRVDQRVRSESIAEWLSPYAAELAECPLYISLDKDVLSDAEAVVNWDSGHLTLPDIRTVLQAFLQASDHKLAGMDVVGDWSPVRVQGLLRRMMHWMEHPSLQVNPSEATRRNAAINLQLLDLVCSPRTESSPLAGRGISSL